MRDRRAAQLISEWTERVEKDVPGERKNRSKAGPCGEQLGERSHWAVHGGGPGVGRTVE